MFVDNKRFIGAPIEDDRGAVPSQTIPSCPAASIDAQMALFCERMRLDNLAKPSAPQDAVASIAGMRARPRTPKA